MIAKPWLPAPWHLASGMSRDHLQTPWMLLSLSLLDLNHVSMNKRYEDYTCEAVLANTNQFSWHPQQLKSSQTQSQDFLGLFPPPWLWSSQWLSGRQRSEHELSWISPSSFWTGLSGWLTWSPVRATQCCNRLLITSIHATALSC